MVDHSSAPNPGPSPAGIPPFREVDASYEVMFDAASVGLVLTAADGRIIRANPAFERMMGTTAERLRERTIQSLTHPEDLTVSPFSALVRGNLDHYEVSKRYLRDDGTIVRAEVSVVRLPGEPVRTLGTIRPLARELVAAAAMGNWLRAAFEAQPHGGAILTRDGRVVIANAALLKMFGIGPDKVIGRPLAELTGPGGPIPVADLLREGMEGPRRVETTLLRGNEAPLPIEIDLLPLTIEGEERLVCAVRDRSPRLALEAARAEEESRYRGLVERAPVVTYSFSTVRGGLFYSPQVEGILGHTPSELTRRPFLWFESIHPEDQPKVHEALAQLEARQGFDLELRVRHKNGNWCWLREWSASVERRGDELIIVGQALDLTPLREQERRFQRMVENVPDILYRWSVRPTPHFNYISDAAERILGYPPADFLADPGLLERCFVPADWASAMAKHQDPSQDRRSYRLRGHHRSGRPVTLDVRRTVIRDPAGEVIAVEGVARDITAAVEADVRNALLSAGLEQAAEVVMITDRAGRIVEVNAAFEHVTGYPRTEVLGQTPAILKSGFQGEEFYARMWQVLTSGQIFRGTLVNRKRDGSNYVAEAVITPIRDADGEIVNFVGLQRDVSRERLLDEALRQSQKMEAVGQVTGGVAHDFNNMLTVILANANLLAAELAPDSDAAVTLREMVAAAQHGTGLVRQLLAYGRKERLSPRPIRLTDEFSAFVTILRRALSENIELAFAGRSSCWAAVDRTAFEQMLLNLATNARDAMPQGGRLTVQVADHLVTESEAAVSAGGRLPGHYATISVTDTGVGIPPEVLGRVFDPFFTTKPVGKGTGLGMSMVFGLMQQHGGWVGIESAVGVGTTVTLGFPVVPAPPAVAAPPRSALPEGPPGRGELILVVEDEDALRRVALRTLEREGFAVVPAADGEAAWTQWRERGETIALILTDAVMPKLGGPELIRRLRADGCATPVILMSGYSAEDLSDPLLQDVPVVAKPWDGATLARRIREVLDAKMDEPAA